MQDLKELIERSVQIRKRYHALERQFHGSEWTVSEDALAFLTDAGLVGRLTMAKEGRWPTGEKPDPQLAHKLAECVWWLFILADRMDMDIGKAMDTFLTKTENGLAE